MILVVRRLLGSLPRIHKLMSVNWPVSESIVLSQKRDAYGVFSAPSAGFGDPFSFRQNGYALLACGSDFRLATSGGGPLDPDYTYGNGWVFGFNTVGAYIQPTTLKGINSGTYADVWLPLDNYYVPYDDFGEMMYGLIGVDQDPDWIVPVFEPTSSRYENNKLFAYNQDPYAALFRPSQLVGYNRMSDVSVPITIDSALFRGDALVYNEGVTVCQYVSDSSEPSCISPLFLEIDRFKLKRPIKVQFDCRRSDIGVESPWRAHLQPIDGSDLSYDAGKLLFEFDPMLLGNDNVISCSPVDDPTDPDRCSRYLMLAVPEADTNQPPRPSVVVRSNYV